MKKFTSGFIAPTLLALAALVIVGGSFYAYSKRVQSTDPSVITNTAAGVTFSIPTGWRVWEGASAGNEFLLAPNVVTNMETAIQELQTTKTISSETAEKIQPYQAVLNTWNVSTAQITTFTGANIDSTNRDIISVAKTLSLLIDSQEMLDQKAITMTFSSEKIEPVEPSDDQYSEKKNITIGDVSAIFGRAKRYKLVDMVIVAVPLNTKQGVRSAIFHGYVKKDDAAAVDAFISFISDLRLTDVQ